MKIVSLLPSATEIVCELGLGDQLAGVTFECDYPTEVRSKPVVSRSAIAPSDDPAAIDQAVSEQQASGEPLYRLDETLVSEIAPDLILTQDLCRVCAVPSGDVDAALDRLGCRAEVVSLDPTSLDDVIADIERVGEATGAAAEAARLVGELRRRIDAVESAVADRDRPRTLVLEWVDPPFTAGHWIPDLVERAGGEALLGRPGAPSTRATWEQVAAEDPDLVVVSPCGFHLDDARRQAGDALARLASTRACADGRVYAVDADSYMVRPGPRLVTGLEALAWVQHPEAVPEPPPGVIEVVPSRPA